MDHVPDYFALTGQTMYRTNDQKSERVFQQVRTMEARLNLKMTKNLTGTKKLKTAHTSITTFNTLAKYRRLYRIEKKKKK